VSSSAGTRMSDHLARRDPLTDRFLIDWAVRRFAQVRPEHTAIVFGDRRVSYRELDQKIDRTAALFRAAGAERGDRIIVALENSLEAVLAFYGALRCDAVPSLIAPAMKPKRIASLVAFAEAKIFVAAANSPALAEVRDVATLTPDRLWDAPEAPPPERRSIELDLAIICWTSGSTGESKGVMLTHQNLRNSATAIGTYLEHRDDEVILCVLPLSHTYGMFQMLVTHQFGGTLVLEKGFGMAWPMVQRMVAERVTGFAGVPTIFASMLALKNLPSADLSSVRYLTNAAYGLPAPQIVRLREVLPKVRFFAMYGQTEATRIAYLPPEKTLERPSSVGISFTNQECWIEREDGTRAAPDEVGELVVRGSNVMRGYWKNPEATARALRPGPVPGEVVHHTGDLFKMDADGFLYFVARMDDIIKTRGEKVAPLEVEAVITKIPGVIEVAVVGVNDPVLGVAVKAAVVKSPEAVVTADDVKRKVREELDEHAVPKYVEFVDALPKTSSGKVKKSELI
jgi:long-chain acyl-CoA synthetase